MEQNTKEKIENIIKENEILLFMLYRLGQGNREITSFQIFCGVE